MNSDQQSAASCCGGLVRSAEADRAGRTEPPRTGCGGTEAAPIATPSCCASAGPHASAAHSERQIDVTITRASAEDLGGVLSLLESLHLPPAGVADHFDNFLVAKEKDGRLAGAIGLERYGTLGLLRSAAVTRGLQKSGVGSKLTRLLIGFAKAVGLTELVLFTPTARDFFARFGFAPANREDYAARLQASAQWGDCSCRNSAEFMRLELQPAASCGCKRDSAKPAPKAENANHFLRNVTLLAVGAMVAALMYAKLHSFADWLTYSALSIPHAARIAGPIRFFAFELPKILTLLGIAVFVLGVVRSFVTPEGTRRLLARRRGVLGNTIAALIGIVTPFCSCSAVPLFIGFASAGVPLGISLSFLISAPMVNEVALILLFGLFGWRVALLYASAGVVIAIVSGWVIGKLGMEKHVEPWVYTMGTAAVETARRLTWQDRTNLGLKSVRQVLGKVWAYVVLGIAVGSLIHGYVPEGLMSSFMGRRVWWSVPLAVLIGIPIYSGATAMIPVMQALLAKGAALGTSLAFMMSVVGLSTPEMILLRRVLRIPLIATFVGVVSLGILIVGYLFNMVL